MPVTFDWKLSLFEGIMLVLLALFALAHPFLTTLSLNFILGIVLIGVGIVQGVRAFKERLPILFLSGVIALVAGILLLAYPLGGVVTLTLLLTLYFLAEGLVKLIASWQLRSLEGAGWIFFSGLLSLALGILVLSGFPTTALWVIGVYFGIYLLFAGISLIVLSSYLKKRHQPPPS